MHTLSEQADKAPSGSAHETTRAAFTGKTLTRKSAERPVKGAGAVVSLSLQGWGVLGESWRTASDRYISSHVTGIGSGVLHLVMSSPGQVLF